MKFLRMDLHHGPSGYEPGALTAELRRRKLAAALGFAPRPFAVTGRWTPIIPRGSRRLEPVLPHFGVVQHVMNLTMFDHRLAMNTLQRKARLFQHSCGLRVGFIGFGLNTDKTLVIQKKIRSR